MPALEIRAHHHATRAPVTVRCEHGLITAVEPADAATTPDSVWIAPALWDLQMNGYAGIDFQRAGQTTASLTAARALRAAGCTRYLLTLITNEWSALTTQLRELKALRDASPELRAAIVGWHIEGPFMSNQPGFVGAHNPPGCAIPRPRPSTNSARSPAPIRFSSPSPPSATASSTPSHSPFRWE